MQSIAFVESLCFAQKAKNHTKDQSKYHPKGESSKRGRGRRNFRGRGGNKRSDLKCKRCGKIGHTANQCWAPWDSIKDIHNQKKDDNENQDASKSSDSAHCIVEHCNLGINEMTSLSSYTECWMLDIGATSHEF